MTLIIVEDEAGEAEVLRLLNECERVFGGPVAPVLRARDSPARLTRMLADLDHRAVTMSLEDALVRVNSAVPRGTGLLPHHAERPTQVFRTAGVWPAVAALAGALCGTQPRDLDTVDLDAKDLDTVDLHTAGGRRTAIVLVDPRAAVVSETGPRLDALATAGVLCGLVYVIDPVEDRLVLLRSLLVTQLRCQGRFALLSGSYTPTSVAGPSTLHDAGSTAATEQLGREQDLLLISGHANPLDAALGMTGGLCARAGSTVSEESAGVFPCFVDGRCFRQPMMGRQPDDGDGLIGVAASHARVLVLSGCSVAAPGRSWVDPTRGLAYQCQSVARAASIITNSVVLERLEFDLLAIALIADGRAVGDVVQGLNRSRGQVHGHCSSYGAGAGPMTLFGNPRLRLSGFSVHEAEVRGRDEGRRLRVDIPRSVLSDAGEALVKFALPPSSTPPYLILRRSDSDVWCRGIWYSDLDATYVYAWVHGPQQHSTPATQPPADIVLEVETTQHNPADAVRRAAEAVLAQIPFWVVGAEDFDQRAVTADADGYQLPSAALGLVTRMLSAAVRTLSLSPGLLLEEDSVRQACAAVWAQIGAISEQQLRWLAAVVFDRGSNLMGMWEDHFTRQSVVVSAHACTCGCVVRGQRYGFPGSGLLNRVNYQCPACGPVGEDDGSGLLSLLSMPTVVAAGEPLTVMISASAPADSAACLRAVALLESPFHDREMRSSVVRDTLQPGVVHRHELTVEVPDDLTPGIYVFAVVAVLNGSATILRRMVQVSARERERRQIAVSVSASG
ncbi:MAG: hypothetical protein ABI047_11905 [Jatrophihabitantaceae bacterium]